MKKNALIVLCLMLMIMAGCREKPKDRPTLYDKGLSCVTTLSKELDEKYIEYFSSYGAITELVKEFAKQDYTEPESVYELTYSDGGLKQFLTVVIGESAKEIPDAVRDRMKGFSYLVNIINARKGSDYLAVSSILAAEELFVNEAVTKDVAYIYFYKDAYPVMVSFHAGEDGAIHAVGNYIFSDEMKERGADVLAGTDGEAELQMFLQLFEINQIR